MNNSQKEAIKKIDELVKKAHEALNEAEKIADEHKLSFCFNHAYGMGGSYEDGEWYASSHSCYYR